MQLRWRKLIIRVTALTALCALLLTAERYGNASTLEQIAALTRRRFDRIPQCRGTLSDQTASAGLKDGPVEWDALPGALREQFTMGGRIARGSEMLRDVSSADAERQWNSGDIERRVAVARMARASMQQHGDVEVAVREAARSGLTHPYDDAALINVFAALHAHPVDGKQGIVLGSETPWLEAILIGFGAAHVTTVEYRPLSLALDGASAQLQRNLSVATPRALWTRLASEAPPRFDFAFSFSSLEHDGLGRFGDAIDPSADLRTLARLRCALRPRSGRAFVAVPLGPDWLQFNAHRIYGAVRLPALLAGWHVQSAYGGAALAPRRIGDALRRAGKLILFTVTFCANPANNLTCFPSYI